MSPGRGTLARAAACSVLTLALGAPLIHSVGLGHDETFHAAVTLPLLGGGHANPLSHFEFMPLMRDSYQGSFKIFLLYLPFKIFGPGVASLRWTTLAIASLTPFMVVLLATLLYGPILGTGLGVLVASDQALVLAGLYEAAPAVLMLFWKLTALWLLARFWKERQNPKFLAAAGFALGMALWDKSHFLWVLGALPICALLLPWRKARALATVANAKSLAAGFAVGAAPYLLHNLLHPLSSIRNPGNGGWELGVHLAELPRWTSERWYVVVSTLTGRGQYGASGVMSPDSLLFTLKATSGLCAAALALFLLRRRPLPALRQAAIWFLMAFLIFAAACLSPVPVKWHHLYTVYPLPYLGLAALLSAALAGNARLERRARPVLAVFLAACVASQVWNLRRFREDAEVGQGGVQFARAYELTAFWCADFARQEPATAIFVDDGMKERFEVYTAGSFAMRELPANLGAGAVNAEQIERAAVLLKHPGAILVANLPVNDASEHDSIVALLGLLRVGLDPVQTFAYADGRPLIGVYRVRSPMMTAFVEGAVALKAGRRAQARAHISRGLKEWRELRARLDRLEASRSAQGLPAALRVGLGAFAGSAAGDSRADFARAAREAGATQDELDSLDANAPGGLSED